MVNMFLSWAGTLCFLCICKNVQTTAFMSLRKLKKKLDINWETIVVGTRTVLRIPMRLSDSTCDNPRLETKSLYDFVRGEPFASRRILNMFLPDITLRINELDVSGITFPPDLPSDWRRTWTELKKKTWGRGGVATFRLKWFCERPALPVAAFDPSPKSKSCCFRRRHSSLEAWRGFNQREHSAGVSLCLSHLAHI